MTKPFFTKEKMISFKRIAGTRVGKSGDCENADEVSALNEKLGDLLTAICKNPKYDTDYQRGARWNKGSTVRDYLWRAIYLSADGDFKKGSDGNYYGFTIGISYLGDFEIKIDIIADTYKRTDNTYYKGEFKNKGYLYSETITPDEIESYDERKLVNFCTQFIQAHIPTYDSL